MNRRRSAVMAGVVLTGVAGTSAVVLIDRPWSDDTPQTVATAPSNSTAVVTADVARRETVTGTLGRSRTYPVVSPGQGTLTWLPPVGAVIRRGKPAYEVDGRPVILLYGKRPPWRALQSGMSAGIDVQQLEENLKALGYGAGLTVDRTFSSATYWAVRRWQKDSGLPVTGTVSLGQVVFVTGIMRIAGSDLRAGASVAPGAVVQRGTAEQRAITVELNTDVLANVRAGDSVVVVLPGGSTRRGTVASVGAVRQQGDSDGQSPDQATAPVVITVTGEVTGVVEDAQVQVGITVEAHPGVLAVPVTALRALGPTEYEVLVTDGGQTRHVPVEVGIFDEVAGLVEVRGDGLAAGQRVAVPDDAS